MRRRPHPFHRCLSRPRHAVRYPRRYFAYCRHPPPIPVHLPARVVGAVGATSTSAEP
uniref:Uncharacterized protein n=1 Tax=Oryza punctata TaxID=4537 RepID=A0A0E0JJA2_ORYPU